MEFKTVGGHTFAPELLTDGVIIDVGARGFEFSDHFPERMVYCIDPDEKVFEGRQQKYPEKPNRQYHLNLAISDKSGESAIYRNGEATVLKELDPDQAHPFIPCKTITMDELYAITGTNVDILKLDCEGAEYMILGETFKPIPKQISCEFHYHTIPDVHKANIDSIMERLQKDYNVYNYDWTEANGSGYNFWDVLFIRKDIDK